MKALIAGAALLPSMAIALGAEAVEFLGVTPSGAHLNFTFHSDSHESKESTFYYSDKSHPIYKFCWSSVGHDGRENLVLNCGPIRDGKPAAVYLRASNNDQAHDHQQQTFKRAWPNNDGTLINYFRCVSGCTSGAAKIIFQVGHGDEGE